MTGEYRTEHHSTLSSARRAFAKYEAQRLQEKAVLMWPEVAKRLGYGDGTKYVIVEYAR